MAVTVIGVDCATDPRRVGLALGAFDGERVRVQEAGLGGWAAPPDAVIAGWVRAAGEPALLALDAPLGWPAPLIEALGAHRAGEALRGEAHVLFRRSTDRFVRERVGKQSLDVGADRIARTAHAALVLLERLRRTLDVRLPLAWVPQVEGISAIEVYPAATLRAHQVGTQGYKVSGAAGDAARGAVVDALAARMRLGVERGALRESVDALDAAVCLLAAQDFLRGEAMPPPDPRLAGREGWIWVRDPSTLNRARRYGGSAGEAPRLQAEAPSQAWRDALEAELPAVAGGAWPLRDDPEGVHHRESESAPETHARNRRAPRLTRSALPLLRGRCRKIRWGCGQR